jgi:hypothetical protein
LSGEASLSLEITRLNEKKKEKGKQHFRKKKKTRKMV